MMMAASSPSAPQPAAQIRARLLHGLAELWRRCAAVFADDGSERDARSWRRVASRLSVPAGVALLGILWGAVVAVADWNALYLAASLVGCAFILRDFRIGVVLLILLLPVSRSHLFPHAMLGITGLNPFNLLLVGTLGSCLLHGLFDGSVRRFMPRPLFWLYVVPFLVAGALGSRHVGDIAPHYYMREILDFYDTTGYVRDVVAKPLLLVVFALLVGAAVSKSEKPEKFLIPMLISIWVMGALGIVFIHLSGHTLIELATSARGLLSGALGINDNELGRMYVVAYALLLFTWAESKDPRIRLALLASMAMLTVAIVLTFSRGAYLGFVVVIVLFLLWRRNAKTLVFAGFMGAVALFLLPDAVYDRIAYGVGSGSNTISSSRLEMIWLPLVPDVLRSPIYGSGLSSILWSEAMRKADGIAIMGAGHPHNAYLEIVLDMGIVGLILIGAYFVHVWKGFRALSVNLSLSPTLRGFYLGAAAGLASFLVSAVADSSLMPKTEQAFLWLAIGMMYGQRAREPAR
jgi:O-antigen ligase/polysaccharide polymerase Wzy-like membrane protein